MCMLIVESEPSTLGSPRRALGKSLFITQKGSHSLIQSFTGLTLRHNLSQIPETRELFLFFFSRSFWQKIWWTGTSTTRWAGRSLVTWWSSTISIENKLRRKGQSCFGPKIKCYIQYRDVSSMATVLQDIGKFRKQIQRRHKLLQIYSSSFL